MKQPLSFSSVTPGMILNNQNKFKSFVVQVPLEILAPTIMKLEVVPRCACPAELSQIMRRMHCLLSSFKKFPEHLKSRQNTVKILLQTFVIVSFSQIYFSRRTKSLPKVSRVSRTPCQILICG